MEASLQSLFSDYAASIGALGAMAVLMLVQLLIADVAGIRHRHVPGTPVTGTHSDVLFRVTRTVANTNESIAIFVLALFFCMLSGANPVHVGYAAWAFVVSRVLYAVCYYLDLRLLRSTTFGVSLVSLLALLVIGFLA